MSDPLNYTVAIGDIHGMADELAFLLDHLKPRFSPSNARFVLLGDLIDRGPDTPRTLSMVVDLLDLYPGSKLILGNHDAFFLEMLDGTISEFNLNQWALQGGIETMHSYLTETPTDIDDIRSQILAAAPRHRELFKAAVPMVVTEKHCFVHAGINPALPLANQDLAAVRWIRRGFLDYPLPMERMVVHGHSITPSLLPEVHSNRIALDTGSYKSGRISAAIFAGDTLVEFVCARSSLGEILRFDSKMALIGD